MACWQITLREEWASARDPATQRYLLAIYGDKIVTLSDRERETLFAELNDLSCCTAHGSKGTHHMRDKRTENESRE